MRRHLTRILCCTVTLALAPGCARHMLETRAITRFQDSIKSDDLAEVRHHTTEAFEQRALRTVNSLEDLKILRIPDGKTSVVEVEELENGRKRVTVEIGEKKEAKKEVFYELAENHRGQWVVNDVYLKQKKQGVTAYKSVSEQMDLLISVREFLDAWQLGERDAVLASVSPQLREHLEVLPPSYLASLTLQIIEGQGGSKYKPQATMDEKVSVVRLPRRSGELILSLDKTDAGWEVADIAIDTSVEDEHLSSLNKRVQAINECLAFLRAYESEDHDALQHAVTATFYNGCLDVADLASAPLPSHELPQHELSVKVRGNRADFLLENDAEIVKILMVRDEDAEDPSQRHFRVQDVTLYDTAISEERRLSALFTAKPMLQVFTAALAARDLDHLRHASTKDFAHRVWDKLDSETMTRLPLEQFARGEPELLETRFQGSLTVVDVQQNGQRYQYQLREQLGRFYVDDVTFDFGDRHTTLRTVLEYVTPTRLLASGLWHARDPEQQEAALEMLQQNSSQEMNRYVWSQADFVPRADLPVDELRQARLVGFTHRDNKIIITFEEDAPEPTFRAEYALVKEFDRYVVDDVELKSATSDPSDDVQVSLKDFYRVQLANGTARPPKPLARTASAILPASFELPADDEEQPVDDSMTDPLEAAPDRNDQPAEILELWDEAEPIPIGTNK